MPPYQSLHQLQDKWRNMRFSAGSLKRKAAQRAAYRDQVLRRLLRPGVARAPLLLCRALRCCDTWAVVPRLGAHRTSLLGAPCITAQCGA